MAINRLYLYNSNINGIKVNFMLKFKQRNMIIIGGAIINTLKEKINGFDQYEKLIIICILSLFLPFYMCIVVLLAVTVFLLFKGEMVKVYQQTKRSYLLIVFTLVSFITSLYYKNYIGALCTLAVWLIFSVILFYSKHITKNLFEFILDIIIFMSILCAVYGLVEYNRILSNFTDDFELMILNSPENRLNSVFFNANYYAMMIEFFVLMCCYKILNSPHLKNVIYYLSVIMLNLFLLYLTGCRSAWPSLAVAILVMLLVEKKYKFFMISLCLLFIAFILAIVYPQFFPRTNNIIEYFGVRIEIWEVAIQGIRDNFLFGEGPLTYMHIYSKYADIYTQHAHSLYLDPLLSYGIVGVGIMVPYVYENIVELKKVIASKVDTTLISLIISVIAVTMIHGILDYTVYFVQTGFVFLMLISSFYMYQNNK